MKRKLLRSCWSLFLVLALFASSAVVGFLVGEKYPNARAEAQARLFKAWEVLTAPVESGPSS